MKPFIDLNSKTLPPERIAEYALDNPALLQELISGVAPQTQQSARRENCSQALMFMAETWPEILLPHWDDFIHLYKSTNGSSKYVAIYVIASLTKADHADRFKECFEDYFTLLDDKSVMVASHAALNAAKIALSLPDLQPKIIRRLVNVDQTHHDSGHLALIKAYVIEALDQLYPTSSLQPEIMDFVTHQLSCESQKTQKMAKLFIKKYQP